MAKFTDDAQTVLSDIDAFLTAIENAPSFNLGKIELGVGLSPFQFLFMILSKVVRKEDIEKFLVKYLTWALPAIELGVKGLLLARLKAIIDCNSDPRIPYYMRKPLPDWVRNGLNVTDKGYEDIKENQGYGAIVDINAIDYIRMFDNSPLNINDHYYFGVTKDMGVHELARATDMNAFLWYVIRHGKHYNSIAYNEEGNFNSEISVSKSDTVSTLENVGINTTLGVANGNLSNNGQKLSFKTPITKGSTLVGITKDNLSNEIISKSVTMCIKQSYTEKEVGEDKVKVKTNSEFTLVPYSDDTTSANWYTNRKNYFDFLKKGVNARDYGAESPVVNIGFLPNQEATMDIPYGDDSKFIVSIPPKAGQIFYVGKSLPQYVKFLFNENGEPDPHGFYTVYVNETKADITNANVEKELQVLCPYENVKVGYTPETRKYRLYTTNGSLKEGGDSDKINKFYLPFILYPCYAPSSIYEFNYDFIMGMKLYETQSLAKKIVETAMGGAITGQASLGISLNKKEGLYQMRIAEVIKKIMEENTSVSTDCFFTFSNEKYDELLRKSELKRANLQEFNDEEYHVAPVDMDDVFEILNDFNESGDLQENIDVLTRAITQATANITNEVMEDDKYTVGLNFLMDLLKSLVTSIVEALFSPKILLILEVNKQMMGESTSLSVEGLLDAMMSLITSIVQEVMDMVMKEILEWVLELLTKLILKFGTLIATEQITNYAALLKQLLRACSFRRGKKSLLDNRLDEVDYADIDPIEGELKEEC